MRRFVLLAAVACFTFGMAGSTVVAASARPTAHVASCTYGRIGGVVKCLRRGEYCARRYQRQYEHYGFICNKLDYRGRWHLEYY
jgi:hypothetical protein